MMGLFDRLKHILNGDESQDPAVYYNTASSGQASLNKKQFNISESDRQKQVAKLTPREHELYILLLEGYTLKESANRLSIKYSTANTHMTGIYKKLGVSSRAELIINYHCLNGQNMQIP